MLVVHGIGAIFWMLESEISGVGKMLEFSRFTLKKVNRWHPTEIIVIWPLSHTVLDSFLCLLRFQLHCKRPTPYCEAYPFVFLTLRRSPQQLSSRQGVSDAEGVNDSPEKYGYTVPEPVGYISVSFSKQSIFYTG